MIDEAPDEPEVTAVNMFQPALSGSRDSSLDGLLNAVAGGGKVAFSNLYGQTVYPVMALVRLLLRDPALAEEVTQEVFLSVWLRAGRFDSARGRAGACIMAIARSSAIDRIKSAQAARERDHRFATQTVPAAPGSDDDALAAADHQRVRKALDVLTARQRQAIMLAFFGGHSYPETAHLLGVPLPTLKSRVREGLIRLRRHLGAVQATEPNDAQLGSGQSGHRISVAWPPVTVAGSRTGPSGRTYRS